MHIVGSDSLTDLSQNATILTFSWLNWCISVDVTFSSSIALITSRASCLAAVVRDSILTMTKPSAIEKIECALIIFIESSIPPEVCCNAEFVTDRPENYPD